MQTLNLELERLAKIHKIYSEIKEAQAESEVDIDMKVFEELLLITLHLKDEVIELRARVEQQKGR